MHNNELIVHPSRSKSSSSTVLYLEPFSSTSQETENPLSMQIWRVMRQRLHWLVAAVLLGCLLGFGMSLRETPIYTAKASLEIQNPADTSPSVKVGDEAPISAESYLPTQSAILQSRTLHRLTVERLHREHFQSGFQSTSQTGMLRRILRLAPPKPAQSWGASVEIQPSVNTPMANIISSCPNLHLGPVFANQLVNEY